jgi:uncharacterized protein (TIGR03435 family)
MPRGAMAIGMGPNGINMQASAVPITNLLNMLTQFVGRPIFNKTDLKGLFDFRLHFSAEGITFPGAPAGFAPPPPGLGPSGPGGAPAAAADPVPSLFTVIQELGLRLESSKGPVEVLVVDSAQKPTEN